MGQQKLVRGALLLALAVVLQALRLILPLPLPVSTFLIGTLVHMMLATTVRVNGLATAVLMSCMLPVFAYAQGQLLLPVLIPVVWFGNILFVFLVQYLTAGSWRYWLLPPLSKAVAMGLAAYLVVNFLALPNPAVKKMVLLGMSVPQLVTGLAGLYLAQYMVQRLKKF